MGLFKRDKVWWMRFNFEGQQIRQSTETGDRKLAERIYRKVMGEIVEGRWFEKLLGEEKTFNEMMDKYLEEHVTKLRSERSFRGYAKNLKSHFGSYLVTRISPMMINEYKVKRLQQGLKPASINRELATMKKAFNLALKEWQWVRENPVTRITLEKENNKRDRWLTPDEEERLLKTSQAWLRSFIFFALNTGMRLGEILSLGWRGVDLNRKTITVFESKNDEKRTIPINDSTAKMLKKMGRSGQLRQTSFFTIVAKPRWMPEMSGGIFRLSLRRSRSKIFVSTIFGTPSRPGSFRTEWMSTRCRPCWDTRLRA